MKRLLLLFLLALCPLTYAVAQSTTKTTDDAAQQPMEEMTVSEKVAEIEHSTEQGRYLGLKTNLVAWAGVIMNFAVDYEVADRLSVELPVLYSPWYVGEQHAVKTFTVQPEVRYWLRGAGEGHFFGAHLTASWYSVKWDQNRYQDTDRPLLGVGISYGYLLPIAKNWMAEFTIGAGYANTKYDTFYNIDNGARIDTQTKNYWGITRVGASLVYRFNIKK